MNIATDTTQLTPEQLAAIKKAEVKARYERELARKWEKIMGPVRKRVSQITGMELRLIYVDEFKKNLCHYCNTYMSEEPCEPSECWVHDVISQTDTVDAVPAVHGRWEWLGPNRLIPECMCGTCSNCKVRSKYIVNSDICPNCGALMDLKDGDE